MPERRIGRLRIGTLLDNADNIHVRGCKQSVAEHTGDDLFGKGNVLLGVDDGNHNGSIVGPFQRAGRFMRLALGSRTYYTFIDGGAGNVL